MWLCQPASSSNRRGHGGGRPLRRLAATVALLLGGLQGLLYAQALPAQVQYQFTYDRPGADDVTIEISWAPPLDRPRALVMPRAIPMGYGEQRYDVFLNQVVAASASGTHEAKRDEGPRWTLPPGTTRVSYRVDLRRMEREVLAASDASRIRDSYLGALGYSVFAYVDGFEALPARVRVTGPTEWPLFVTLAPRWPFAGGVVEAVAADFYELADAQIVMGPRAELRRLAESPVPLYLAAYAEGPVDLERLGRLAATAFERVAAYFGTVPFAHYTVHQELLQPISARHEYGMSMEHLGSSTYYLLASAGITAQSSAQDDARVLYNFAHHMAHAWVPKRVAGLGYFPFQWEIAPVLDSIWFAEGFGQYAAVMAVAAGTSDPSGYREDMLARRFRSNLAAPPFLRRLSLVELSRVASTRYAEDFRTGRLVFSRGGLMAAAVDDRIQEQTGRRRSLRDAFRFLVAWAARERRSFAIDELADLIQQATGVDTRDVIDAWLRPLDAP
jgi:predicted metalloprotease with PDZ domain